MLWALYHETWLLIPALLFGMWTWPSYLPSVIFSFLLSKQWQCLLLHLTAVQQILDPIDIFLLCAVCTWKDDVLLDFTQSFGSEFRYLRFKVRAGCRLHTVQQCIFRGGLFQVQTIPLNHELLGQQSAEGISQRHTSVEKSRLEKKNEQTCSASEFLAFCPPNTYKMRKPPSQHQGSHLTTAVNRLSAVHVVLGHLRSCCEWSSWLCLSFCRDSFEFKPREVLGFSAPEFLTLKAQAFVHGLVCGSHGDKHAYALRVSKKSRPKTRECTKLSFTKWHGSHTLCFVFVGIGVGGWVQLVTQDTCVVFGVENRRSDRDGWEK